ncbi:11156_t:CDS:2 [Racocetra persica]|uniref:11156_t:CDS:1 n=1 Tax=Racocetra persica TaxID=160502 RepID=A0ACA9L3K7_9GLOM|nr:11156_t:CDS:2 [Racocetra persica]
MSLPPTINDFKPVYNLVELELEDYKENELVLDTIHELKLFFQNSNNCTCCRTPKQKDLRTCFEKVGLELCKVFASKKSGGEEICFQLLYNDNFDKNGQLNTISSVPLSND